LLEGLEISEFFFSDTCKNKDFRTDSDFWTKRPFKNETLNYRPIGSLLKKAQYGISIEMNEFEHGFPIYRMNEIHNMFCDFQVKKHVAIDLAEASKFILNEGDVLFNRTNSYEWVGRTGIYKKQGTMPFIFASYLVRFIPNETELLPEYLTTFLNTSYGIKDIKRRSRESINQTNVNPEEVKEIEIPLLSMRFQKHLKILFDTSYFEQQQSQQAYQQAEHLLLAELGLANFTPSQEGVNIKSFASSFATTGRLDAEYYQPKYEQVVKRIQTKKHKTLAQLVNIQKSVEPGSDHYADEGLPFLRVADYNKFELTEPAKRLSNAYCKDNAKLISKLQPKKDTILFSKDGTVGLAYLLREEGHFITSGAILHLTIKDKNEVLPEYLTLALNSQLVQMQAERDAGGSIIMHWRVSEIEQVIVPVINFDKQKEIALLVEESFKLKAQSETLLEIAKRGVELAIEQDEATAQTWMEAESAKLGVSLKEDSPNA
jgi:type I restriction enzyme, S subunit